MAQRQLANKYLRVFLCHGSEDKQTVRGIYARLREDGIQPWLDIEDLVPGNDWDTEIRQAVRQSHIFLACLSSRSVRKEGYIQKEIKFALDVAEEKPGDTIFIIPVKLDECELPKRLEKYHYVDWRDTESYARILRGLRERAVQCGVEHLPQEGEFVSSLGGRAELLAKVNGLGLKHTDAERVLDEVARLEQGGYDFEGAEASFELLARRLDGTHKNFFELLGFRVIDEHRGWDMPLSEATVRVQVSGHIVHTAASGTGPANALDQALRRALEKFYPALAEVRLIDYKVRIIKSKPGTAWLVRVLITSGVGRAQWSTVGASSNIVEASWRALVDSVEYKLLKDGTEPPSSEWVAQSYEDEFGKSAPS